MVVVESIAVTSVHFIACEAMVGVVFFGVADRHTSMLREVWVRSVPNHSNRTKPYFTRLCHDGFFGEANDLVSA